MAIVTYEAGDIVEGKDQINIKFAAEEVQLIRKIGDRRWLVESMDSEERGEMHENEFFLHY